MAREARLQRIIPAHVSKYLSSRGESMEHFLLLDKKTTTRPVTTLTPRFQFYGDTQLNPLQILPRS